MSFTFGSLFAGIGGFDLGFERAGMECRWQVEIDDFCVQVLEKHWPDVRRYKDVRECGRHNLEPVDLICGGFPCQPFSLAGKLRGDDDDRNLWPQFKRIIGETRPSWVVAENVLGIRTIYLDTVLSDLERLEYTAEAVIIPAVAFDASHRRDRIWIVANSTRQRRRGRNNGNEAGNNRTLQAEGPRSPEEQKILANAKEDQVRARLRKDEQVEKRRGRLSNGSGQDDVSDTGHARLEKREGLRSWGQEEYPSIETPIRWPAEPDVGRVVDGFPGRVDRLRALGNAVVPQIPEFIGILILEVEHGTMSIL